MFLHKNMGFIQHFHLADGEAFCCLCQWKVLYAISWAELLIQPDESKSFIYCICAVVSVLENKTKVNQEPLKPAHTHTADPSSIQAPWHLKIYKTLFHSDQFTFTLFLGFLLPSILIHSRSGFFLGGGQVGGLKCVGCWSKQAWRGCIDDQSPPLMSSEGCSGSRCLYEGWVWTKKWTKICHGPRPGLWSICMVHAITVSMDHPWTAIFKAVHLVHGAVHWSCDPLRPGCTATVAQCRSQLQKHLTGAVLPPDHKPEVALEHQCEKLSSDFQFRLFGKYKKIGRETNF